MKLFLYRALSYVYLILFFIHEKFAKNDFENNKISKRFINYNNRITINRIKRKDIIGGNILLLLPHCLQEDNCGIKVTSDIEKCINCGKCDIGFIKKMKTKYGINVKVATGGTLARKAVKEYKPKIVIAVACERDLVTGIFDSYPMPIYGIFNIRENGPCFNTKISQEDIEKVLTELLKR
jgi:uncharacterized protein